VSRASSWGITGFRDWHLRCSTVGQVRTPRPEGRAMKKQATKRIKDLKPQKDGDVKGGTAGGGAWRR